MTSKSKSKFLSELLHLKGIKVIEERQHEGIGIILNVQAENQDSICPRCGTKSQQLHQNHRYLVKDLPLSGQPVYLEVNRRQFKCKKCCKPFSEDLDFVNKRRTYTKRLAQDIVRQVLEHEPHSIAKRSHVTMEEIETMLKDL
jgi:transposase